MRLDVVTTVGPDDRAALRRLLDAAFDDFDDDDWEHSLGGHHVFAVDGDTIVGHAAVVERPIVVGSGADRRGFRTGYVEAVATAPEVQGRGVAAAVMERTTELVRARFELGGLCTGLDGFYERFGWERWLGPTHVRRDGTTVRTPDEDGLVFVLRHGPSAVVDLTAAISCDGRRGDDW